MSADHHKTKNKINVSKCTFIYFLLRKVYLVLLFARSLTFNNESGFSDEDPDHNYLKRSRSPGPLKSHISSFQKDHHRQTSSKSQGKSLNNPQVQKKSVKATNLHYQMWVLEKFCTWSRKMPTLSNHIIIQKLIQP
jgi:hypothetical protein